MPRPFNPRTSTAHRQACLTLYRALLRATHQFGPPISTTLHNLVTYDFKQARKTISLHDINAALSAGREALSTIARAANGERAALDKLTQKLEQRAEQVKKVAEWRYHCAVTLRQPTRKTKLDKVRHIEHSAKKSSNRPKQETDPNAPPPILKVFEEARRARAQEQTKSKSSTRTPTSNADEAQDRNLPEIQAETVPILARTPTYTEAQGVPFLRFLGRNSPGRHEKTSFHSRMVRDLIISNERRWETRGKLEEDMMWGSLEDEWDRILLQVCGLRDNDCSDVCKDAVDGDPLGQDEPQSDELELYNWNGLTSPIPLKVLRNLRSKHAKSLPHLKSWTQDAYVVECQIAAKIREQDAVRKVTARKMWDFVQEQKRMKADRKEERRRVWEEKQKEKQDAGEVIMGLASETVAT